MVAHIVVAEAVVEVHVGVDNLADFEAVRGDEVVEQGAFAVGDHAGVDDEGIERVGVVDNEGAYAEWVK